MKTKSSKYNNRLEYLLSTNKQERVNLNLKNIKHILNKMGNPSKHIPAIQIAGTNGKGSIASFIQSSLNCLKIKNGMTISPHLVDWRERIQINGQMISSKDLEQRIEKISKVDDKKSLSSFEKIIAASLDYFQDNSVQLIVLEVGLGGRLDATTAHPFRPIIVFSNIGLDHCEYLGESLKEIAEEKASIINTNSIVISPKQDSIVETILIKKAAEKNSLIKWVKPLSEDWELGLKGEIQKSNAAVAKAALETLEIFGWDISKNKIKKGLALAKWPGRLQAAKWHDLRLLIDGAHNSPAAKQLALERKNWEGNENGVQWILGIQKHKDAPEMLRHLIQPKDNVWIVPVAEQESWTKNDLLKVNKKWGYFLRESSDIEKVLHLLSSDNKKSNQPIIITGSLYLIGHLLNCPSITTYDDIPTLQ